jgi:2-oxoglutarate-dependent dioxygenase
MPDSYLAQSSEYLAGSMLDELNNGEELRRLVSQFMGGASSLYLPFTAVKGAHQGGFGFHQDNQYTRHDGPSCNCWIALGRCSSAHGCLQLVPGSHKNGTLASKAMFVDEDGNESHRTVVEAPAHYVDIELNPGDAVLFNRLTVHGSGPNKTDEPRVGYAVQFHRNDTRWYDRETDTWALLKDQPRWHNHRVETFSTLAAVGE